jgi:hypothetical protein
MHRSCLIREGVTGESSNNAPEGGGALFLKVVDETATLIHEEHLPIMLSRGLYRVRRQREYSPLRIGRIED